MKFGLIISNDWELFGDGSGNYFELQHRPLNSLLNVVRERGAKLTIMAELGQQFAHQLVAESESWAREIVNAWESILRDAMAAGNDVQMHLHPQWLDAVYQGEKWHLNFSKWAVSSLPPEEIKRVFVKGKRYLENLLRPIEPGYECIAFRAGGYCIQPSAVVIGHLESAGILCDSSVVPGMYNPPFVDFRNAFSNVFPWYVDSTEIKFKSGAEIGLLEIPLCCYVGFDLPILRKYVSKSLFSLLCFGTTMTKQEANWSRQRRAAIAERYPAGTRPFQGSRIKNLPFGEKLKFLFTKAFGCKKEFVLDYDQLSSRIFVKCLQRIYDCEDLRGLRSKDVILPIVAIGHVKNMHNCENVERILDDISTNLRDRVVYWTLGEAVRYWLSLLQSDPSIISLGDS